MPKASPIPVFLAEAQPVAAISFEFSHPSVVRVAKAESSTPNGDPGVLQP